MTKEQKQILVGKIQLCKEGKIGANDVIRAFEDILYSYIEDKETECSELQKQIHHWRNKSLQKGK